jgi:peptidoglycan hydrolase CwlO-like protein
MANLDAQVKESQAQVAEAQSKIAELTGRIETARAKLKAGDDAPRLRMCMPIPR